MQEVSYHERSGVNVVSTTGALRGLLLAPSFCDDRERWADTPTACMDVVGSVMGQTRIGRGSILLLLWLAADVFRHRGGGQDVPAFIVVLSGITLVSVTYLIYYIISEKLYEQMLGSMAVSIVLMGLTAIFFPFGILLFVWNVSGYMRVRRVGWRDHRHPWYDSGNTSPSGRTTGGYFLWLNEAMHRYLPTGCWNSERRGR